jgi:CubicO group peptidase (beta-lactamase class C family)
MQDIQQQVQSAVEELVESGAERGLQVAVYHHGRLVADAVAGIADAATGRAVEPQTLFYSTSTGKALTSAVAHVLVERGVVGYDTAIAEVWPEFAANGKQGVTLRHVLTHTCGLPGVPAETTPKDLADWAKMTRALEGAGLWWEPGTKTGYHPQSFGYLVGEVARRATGKPMAQLLAELVAEPLGVGGELFFGVPKDELGRCARLEDAPVPEGAQMPEMSEEMFAEIPFFKVVDGFTAAPMAALPDAAFGNREDILTADIPAGGTFTARAVAKLYAALLGEVDGVRLVSERRLREISAEAVSGTDEVIGFPVARALGFDIGYPSPMAAPAPTVFGTAGTEGSAAWADTATGVAFALTKNRVTQGDYSAVQRLTEVVTKAVA